MTLIVHKYGGTSMGSTERIKNVARRVAKWHDAGHQIVVVPSAMSGETNRLLGLAKEINADPDPRELDMLASTGEQASVALLAIALQSIGKEAVSYTGWQVPIITDSAYTKSRIQSIDDVKVKKDLDAGKVVVITGFQGMDADGNITTLGRGGSDLWPVPRRGLASPIRGWWTRAPDPTPPTYWRAAYRRHGRAMTPLPMPR